MKNQIPNNWQKLKLGDVAEFQNGYSFSSRDFIKRSEDAFPVFKMGNIRVGGGLRWTGKEDYFPTEKMSGLLRFVTNPGEILMCMTDMKGNIKLLGYSAYIKDEKFLVNQRVGRILAKTGQVDSKFLYYYLNSPDYLAYIRSTSRSGVQVNLTTEEIKNSLLIIPSYSEQTKLGQLLSAFDDKIELNYKVVETLEEMAQTIFNKTLSGVEGKEYSFSDLANFVNGGAFGKIINKENKGLPLLKIADLNRGISDITEYINKDISERYYVQDGDLLFSWSGSLDLYIWGSGKAVLNQHIFNIIPKDKFSRGFLYFVLKQKLRYFKQIASSKATTMGHIKKEHLEEQTVIIPNDLDLGIFDIVYRKLLQLKHENQKLAMMRDLLLPKLMKGEIRV